MKNFIWTIKSEKASRMYGGADVEVSIYRILRGRAVFVMRTNWCTRSYKGGDSEVMNALARHGDISKSHRDGYYKGHHCGPVAGQNFTISEV